MPHLIRPAVDENKEHVAHYPHHREAKGQVRRWYDGYRIVISEVKATYGDGRLPG